MTVRRLILLVCLLIVPATPLHAGQCLAQFDILTEAVHGTLPSGTLLRGVIDYDEGRALRMGSETVSYLSTGTMTIIGPDGGTVTGTVRAIHVVRTPHFADYVSFDTKDVTGDLGGVDAYENPMLVTLFAPRGSLTSFDLPKDTQGWTALSRRQVFQVHTPDTMWTLPGAVSRFTVHCR